jgi:hypothetical protein
MKLSLKNQGSHSHEASTTAGWAEWSLSDWNCVLLRNVFFDKERLSFPITRINASEHFLAKCADAPECERDEVKSAFIKAFGNTEEKIRRCFSGTGDVPAFNKIDGQPNFFAMLYLTLLAASADDATYDIGNFRVRLPALLLPVVMECPNLRLLPEFWERLRKWSAKRARERGDCRRIELPNHGREIIIGISKRLAFPGFRDERALAKLMSDASVDGTSEYHQVDRAVSGRLSEFSANFKAEFDIFRKFVDAADLSGAYESDFWNAVRDISWEIRKNVAESVGEFCLGLEWDDPIAPALYLLADTIGVSALASRGKASPFFDGRFIVAPVLNVEWTLPELAGVAGATKLLQGSRIWKCLQLGCVAFFPDAYGRMNTDGTYYEGCNSCFALVETLAKTFLERAKHYNVKYTITGTRGMSGGWKLVSIGPISAESMSRMVESLPEAVRNGIGFGWRPPRPSWAGGAWFGQALLLSPASVPVVKMAGAISGGYEIFGEGTESILAGALEQTDDGFCIPASDLLGLHACSRLTVRLDLRDATAPAELSVPLLARAPFGVAGALKDRSVWLGDGPAGSLSPVFPADGNAIRKSGPAANVLHTAWPVPQLALSRVPSWGATMVLDLGDIPQPLDWLCEALSLRFQCRTTPLSFSQLAMHAEPSAAAGGTKRWRLVRLIAASAWICPVERSASSHRSVALADRTIAIHSGGDAPVARIVGMFTHAERARIEAFLEGGESARRLGACGRLALGPIEVQLGNPSRLDAFARKFDLTCLSRDEFGPPLAPSGCLPAPTPSSGRELSSADKLEMWNSSERKWTLFERSSGPVPTGTIVKVASYQKNTYWVFGNECHWKTDSETWAFILFLGATRTPVGVIAANGDCKFNPMLRGIPHALARWWMHWGGGCIELALDGSVVFSGGAGEGLWNCIGGWSGPPRKLVASVDIALRRRSTALSVRSRDMRSRAST